jgi:NADH:ubiquinone oxidoreductase subunit 2 (subunit N)
MKRIALIGAMLALPALTFAAQINDIQGVGSTITDLINNVAVPVLFAIAFIVFIYGVFQFFILGAKDEEKQATGRSLMLWGLIGFFVMVSVWGLVNILVGTFNVNNNLPSFPTTPKP